MLSSTEFLRLMKKNGYDLQQTTNPYLFCTRLPTQYRRNKKLPTQFMVIASTAIPNGSIVSVGAGNETTPLAQLRNAETVMENGIAIFHDLRFASNSGRGKRFHISIAIHTDPFQMVIIPHAIKITSDGYRGPRKLRLDDFPKLKKAKPTLHAQKKSKKEKKVKREFVLHRPKAVLPPTPPALGDYYKPEISQIPLSVIVSTVATMTSTTTTTTTSITTGMGSLWRPYAM